MLIALYACEENVLLWIERIYAYSCVYVCVCDSGIGIHTFVICYSLIFWHFLCSENSKSLKDTSNKNSVRVPPIQIHNTNTAEYSLICMHIRTTFDCPSDRHIYIYIYRQTQNCVCTHIYVWENFTITLRRCTRTKTGPKRTQQNKHQLVSCSCEYPWDFVACPRFLPISQKCILKFWYKSGMTWRTFLSHVWYRFYLILL